LLFPKRPPPRVLEPAGVPVAATVVLPVALEFPVPGNKLPPLPPVPVGAPVPGAKGLAPEAGGFGKPNRDPEIDSEKAHFRNYVIFSWCAPPVPPPVVAPVVLPNRPGPVVVPEVPGFELAFVNNPPPVAGAVDPVFVAGFAEQYLRELIS
jgi:hypothetical protein